jgi:hypothetical protein
MGVMAAQAAASAPFTLSLPSNEDEEEDNTRRTTATRELKT